MITDNNRENQQQGPPVTSVPLDLFGRLELKPVTVLSGLLTVSKKYFFGIQVKFFVLQGGILTATCSQRHREMDQLHKPRGGSWQARAFLEGAFNDLVLRDGSDH